MSHFGNAGEVPERLRAAIAPGVSVVVADLTTTAFCDSSVLLPIYPGLDEALAGEPVLNADAPRG